MHLVGFPLRHILKNQINLEFFNMTSSFNQWSLHVKGTEIHMIIL